MADPAVVPGLLAVPIGRGAPCTSAIGPVLGSAAEALASLGAGTEMPGSGALLTAAAVVCGAESVTGTVLPATPEPADGPCTEGSVEAATVVPATETVAPTEAAGCDEAETVVEADTEVDELTEGGVTDVEAVTPADGEACTEADAAGAETETAAPELPAGTLTLTDAPVPGT